MLFRRFFAAAKLVILRKFVCGSICNMQQFEYEPNDYCYVIYVLLLKMYNNECGLRINFVANQHQYLLQSEHNRWTVHIANFYAQTKHTQLAIQFDSLLIAYTTHKYTKNIINFDYSD